MQKDFKAWHGVKQTIQDFGNRWFCREREVCWCSIGLNIGSEIDGKGGSYRRPVLVVKKLNRDVCLCIPLTTKVKDGAYYVGIDLGDGIARIAVLSQVRVIDTRRLRGRIGFLNREQFQKIKQALINIIA